MSVGRSSWDSLSQSPARRRRLYYGCNNENIFEEKNDQLFFFGEDLNVDREKLNQVSD